MAPLDRATFKLICTAERLLERAGGQALEVIVHAGKPLTVFQSAD
jgi:hypothetical protein